MGGIIDQLHRRYILIVRDLVVCILIVRFGRSASQIGTGFLEIILSFLSSRIFFINLKSFLP